LSINKKTARGSVECSPRSR